MSKKGKSDKKVPDCEGKEHRRESRVHADLRVKIFAGGHDFSGVSKNLSCGGVLIRAPKEVLGKDLDRLSMQIQDNEKPVEIDADIAWSSSEREDDLSADDDVNIGLQFRDLDEDVKEQIQDYIEKFVRGKAK